MTKYNLNIPTMRKIKERMDKLQEMMESNHHLHNPEEVVCLIRKITPFWGVMDDEDKDYIHGAQYALEENMEWKLP